MAARVKIRIEYAIKKGEGKNCNKNGLKCLKSHLFVIKLSKFARRVQHLGTLGKKILKWEGGESKYRIYTPVWSLTITPIYM